MVQTFTQWLTKVNKSKDNLKSLLESAGAVFRALDSCLCPFHNDKHPSGLIKCGDDGIWRFKCFACQVKGDYYDIKDLIENKSKGTAFTEAKQPAKQPAKGLKCQADTPKVYTLKEIEGNGGTIYKYTNPDAKRTIELIVVRRDKEGGGKRFTQYRQGCGAYVAGGLQVLPLYNRSRIRENGTVVVVEGEKKVHSLHRVGITATTKPMGASSPESADWAPLYGKTAILWPDADEVGIKYMNQVKALLLPHCKVKWIDPKKYGLPEKGDAHDWCEMVKWDKVIARLPLEEAVDCGASDGVRRQLTAIASGKRTAIELPWTQTRRLSQALIPQTTTLICGEGGDGKSLFMSQAMIKMMQDGIKVALYDLEEDIEHRLSRALAQIEGNSGWLDYEWLAGKEKEVSEACDRHAEFMDKLGRCIWAAPDAAIQRSAVLEWIDARAKEGFRVIIIDPVTALARSPKAVYAADEEFVLSTKALSRKYGVSIVYVTHPTKGRLNPVSIDGLQGGSAYGRGCQTIIWVQWVEKKNVTCQTALGKIDYNINRKVHLLKTRNGKGRAVLGFWFDSNTLNFTEHGMIVKGK